MSHQYSGGHIPEGLCHQRLRVSNTTLLGKKGNTTYITVVEKQELGTHGFSLGSQGWGAVC